MEENRKGPSTAQIWANQDLLRYWEGLSVEQQRILFRQMREMNESNDNVVTLDEMLLVPEFRNEAQCLARGAGIDLLDFAIALNPRHYESYSSDSTQCRIDRYLSGVSPEVDLRVQVKTRVEFSHSLVVAPFRVIVLRGEISIEQGGLIQRYDDDTILDVEEGQQVKIVAHRQSQFLYLDHPLSAWIRRTYLRKEA